MKDRDLNAYKNSAVYIIQNIYTTLLQNAAPTSQCYEMFKSNCDNILSAYHGLHSSVSMIHIPLYQAKELKYTL